MADSSIVTEEIDVGSVYPGDESNDQGLGGFSVGEDFTIPDYTPTINTSSNVPAAVIPVPQSASVVSVPSVSAPVIPSSKRLISSSLVSPLQSQSPSQSPSPSQPKPSPVGTVTMDQLIKVSNAINLTDECQDMAKLIQITGLDESTINKCVDWLNSQGLAPRSATLICGVAAVKKLQSQLISFSK